MTCRVELDIVPGTAMWSVTGYSTDKITLYHPHIFTLYHLHIFTLYHLHIFPDPLRAIIHYPFKLVRGTILFVLERAVHTFFLINL